MDLAIKGRLRTSILSSSPLLYVVKEILAYNNFVKIPKSALYYSFVYLDI